MRVPGLTLYSGREESKTLRRSLNSKVAWTVGDSFPRVTEKLCHEAEGRAVSEIKPEPCHWIAQFL